jgi:hypothetical protein
MTIESRQSGHRYRLKHPSVDAIRNAMRHISKQEAVPPYTRETKAIGETAVQNAAEVINSGHAVKPIETDQEEAASKS